MTTHRKDAKNPWRVATIITVIALVAIGTAGGLLVKYQYDQAENARGKARTARAQAAEAVIQRDMARSDLTSEQARTNNLRDQRADLVEQRDTLQASRNALTDRNDTLADTVATCAVMPKIADHLMLALKYESKASNPKASTRLRVHGFNKAARQIDRVKTMINQHQPKHGDLWVLCGG